MAILSRGEACRIRRLIVCSGFIRLLQQLAGMCWREVAGLVVGVVGHDSSEAVVREVVFGCNIASSPSTSFLLDPSSIYDALRVAEEGKHSVIGLFHTHPGGSAVLSVRDIEGTRLWPILWLVAGNDGVRCFNPCGSGVEMTVADYTCSVKFPSRCSLC